MRIARLADEVCKSLKQSRAPWDRWYWYFNCEDCLMCGNRSVVANCQAEFAGLTDDRVKGLLATAIAIDILTNS